MCNNQKFTDSDQFLIVNKETGEPICSTCYTHALSNLDAMNRQEQRAKSGTVWVLRDQKTGVIYDGTEPVPSSDGDHAQFRREGFRYALCRINNDSLAEHTERAWHGYKITDPIFEFDSYLSTAVFPITATGEEIHRHFAEQYEIANA